MHPATLSVEEIYELMKESKKETDSKVKENIPRILQHIYFLTLRDGDDSDWMSKLSFEDKIMVVRALEYCLDYDELQQVAKTPYNSTHAGMMEVVKAEEELIIDLCTGPVTEEQTEGFNKLKDLIKGIKE